MQTSANINKPDRAEESLSITPTFVRTQPPLIVQPPPTHHIPSIDPTMYANFVYGPITLSFFQLYATFTAADVKKKCCWLNLWTVTDQLWSYLQSFLEEIWLLAVQTNSPRSVHFPPLSITKVEVLTEIVTGLGLHVFRRRAGCRRIHSFVIVYPNTPQPSCQDLIKARLQGAQWIRWKLA